MLRSVGLVRSMSRFIDLSREQLIARLEALDPTPSAGPSSPPKQTGPPPKSTIAKNPKQPKPFHFPSHPTRHIALLIAYNGWPYSGLAIQPATPTTSEAHTVEGELLKALERAKLVEQGKGWEGCGYSRCGRTDRGVSGEGQVVDLWVRSTRRVGDRGADVGEGWRAVVDPPVPTPPKPENGDPHPTSDRDRPPPPKANRTEPPTELPYPRILNSILPPSIRILAWSPVSPSFNSRFSCLSRHYEYTFHRGTPTLDLSLMRSAAAHLVGEHDFRNFCRLDGSKQITSHRRRVIRAWFDEGPTASGDRGTVVFNLIGTAFLWHQVRHIMGVLFLVGSGLESPGIVSELLDVETNPSRPNYVMAHPLPLTLHACEYGQGELDWRVSGYDGAFSPLTVQERGRLAPEERAMRESLERSLEEATQEEGIRARQVGGGLRKLLEVFGPLLTGETGVRRMVSHPVGGGETVISGKYRRVMERVRGGWPEEVNRKWREKKGVV